MTADEDSKEKDAEGEEEVASEKREEASATKKEASAVSKLGSSFKKWATTYDKEREIAQAQALKRGAQSVGRTVGTPMLAAVKTSSILLLLIGIVHYFLRYFYGTSTAIFIISLVLFLIAGFALAARLEKERVAILLPMLLFVIWYWVFNASISISIILGFLIIGGIILGLIALLTKGESIAAELMGFIPVVFLFFDVGLLSFLVEKLNLTITPLIEVLVVYMPWWAYLGLFTLPEHVTESKFLGGLLGLLKVVGFMYIILLVISVAIPGVGYEEATTTVLPSIEELEQAQGRVRGQIDKGESSFISNFICLTTDPTNLNVCVIARQAKVKYQTTCNAKEEVKQGVVSLDDCVAEEEKKVKENVQVAGAVNKDVKPTVARIDIPPAPLQYTTRPVYSATLLVENPRAVELHFVLNCTFKRGVVIIPGEVSVQGTTAQEVPLPIKAEVAQIPLTCSPAKDFTDKEKAAYQMMIQATIQKMVTESSLERAFLGQVSEEERVKLTSQITRDRFSSAQKVYSKAPAEFARINFGFGSPEQNPILTSTDVPRFVSSVENVGGGKIVAIEAYSYSLQERGFSVRSGQQDCLSGKKIKLPEDVPPSFGLGTCFLTLPGDLSSFQGTPKIETFFAKLVYDYSISREATVQVQVIS
ncbi:hypothetical protein HYT55_04340 [Candidatus Woesearchaeota archaeon]|nr:hypothetical protein [Candidatus Woesearchaeota archaeon]